MIIVIQCAGRKRSGAGHLLSASAKPIIFVADPGCAPPDPDYEYARPDDLSGRGVSWRQELVEYNAEARSNPLALYPAYELYANKTYGRLVNRFGLQSVYILSARWGLLKADFLTPYYDITLCQRAKPYQRRRKADDYKDLCMMARETDEEIVFFGGKDYLDLFGAVTSAIRSRKTVFYNSISVPKVTGCTLTRFETTTKTNWHYECANAFLAGAVRIL
jgi:hypothetical protein